MSGLLEAFGYEHDPHDIGLLLGSRPAVFETKEPNTLEARVTLEFRLQMKEARSGSFEPVEEIKLRRGDDEFQPNHDRFQVSERLAFILSPELAAEMGRLLLGGAKQARDHDL